MKKKLVIFTILFTVVALFLLTFNKKEKNIKTEFNLDCYLNIENCEISYKNKQVLFSFSNKPVRAMIPNTLKISNLEGNFTSLNAKIKGVNMNMGTIKANFIKNGEIYKGELIFSSCYKDMLYEISFFDDKKPLNLKVFVVITL
ncbi:hypothetical protein [Campylobacter ureolyticus]|uniref:hypothetical protein n=1 Tax=Campylobacter ureolyticus TaxID=827 RepID=UPI0029087A98|nr:hypothetical protein [Campylobacter ureolyticus]MDU5326245.1 hypothetical protein [Campylobacter ureolyticus]